MPQRIVCPIHGKFQTQCGCTKEQMTYTNALMRRSGQMLDAAPGYAELAEYIARELREARLAKRMALKGGEKYHDAAEYWEGNIVALVKLRKAFVRTMKAPHNGRISCDPNNQ